MFSAKGIVIGVKAYQCVKAPPHRMVAAEVLNMQKSRNVLFNCCLPGPSGKPIKKCHYLLGRGLAQLCEVALRVIRHAAKMGLRL